MLDNSFKALDESNYRNAKYFFIDVSFIKKYCCYIQTGGEALALIQLNGTKCN